MRYDTIVYGCMRTCGTTVLRVRRANDFNHQICLPPTDAGKVSLCMVLHYYYSTVCKISGKSGRSWFETQTTAITAISCMHVICLVVQNVPNPTQLSNCYSFINNYSDMLVSILKYINTKEDLAFSFLSLAKALMETFSMCGSLH